MVFYCHFGNSVEKTAVILSRLYVIGLKILLRDLVVRTSYDVFVKPTYAGASFTKKDRTISLKMSVRSFLRSAYVGFTQTS